MGEKEQLINELYKPVRRKFPRRKVVLKGINDIVLFDLMDMQALRNTNRKVRYLLVAINGFTKKVVLVPLRNKTAKAVATATEEALTAFNQPFKLASTDQGSEFKSKFLDVLEKRGIKHYYAYNESKVSLVERFIRTIKQKIYKSMALRGSSNYIDVLQSLVDEYHSDYHNTLKMSPNEVNKKNEKLLLNTVFNYKTKSANPKFKIGDIVRVSKKQYVFDKGYFPHWSEELFKVHKTYKKFPIMHILSNLDEDEVIKGGFYEDEMQKVKNPDVYLIDKILARKKNLIKVRFRGLGSNHDQWIKKKDLL